MELRQLVYFEAVARHGGFRRAADRLHVAQPAISTQIRALERELGVALFERTTRSVRLTAAGELALTRARTVLSDVNALSADIADLLGVRSGRLRIGTTHITGGIDVPAELARFRQTFPGVDVAVRTGVVADLLAALSVGELDSVLAPIHDDTSSDFARHVLRMEELVLVSGRGTTVPRRSRDLVSWREHAFVCLPEGTGLRRILTVACDTAGFTPRVVAEASDPEGICRFVAAGLGVGLVVRTAAVASRTDVRVHELRPRPAHPPIGLLWYSGRPATPATAAWHRQLQELGRAGPGTATARRSAQPADPSSGR